MLTMTLGAFLADPTYAAWEDDQFLVVRTTTEMHGEPAFSVTNYAAPEAGAKVYRDKDKVAQRLGDDRTGTVS